MQIDAALAAARADATHCADETHAGTGWRKAPAQSTVVATLITNRPRADILAIFRVWNDAYHKHVVQLTSSL